MWPCTPGRPRTRCAYAAMAPPRAAAPGTGASTASARTASERAAVSSAGASASARITAAQITRSRRPSRRRRSATTVRALGGGGGAAAGSLTVMPRGRHPLPDAGRPGLARRTGPRDATATPSIVQATTLPASSTYSCSRHSTRNDTTAASAATPSGRATDPRARCACPRAPSCRARPKRNGEPRDALLLEHLQVGVVRELQAAQPAVIRSSSRARPCRSRCRTDAKRSCRPSGATFASAAPANGRRAGR